jgi:hypothetical protein
MSVFYKHGYPPFAYHSTSRDKSNKEATESRNYQERRIFDLEKKREENIVSLDSKVVD